MITNYLLLIINKVKLVVRPLKNVMEWLALVLFLLSNYGWVSSASNTVLYGFEGRGSNPRLEDGDIPFFDVNIQNNITAIALETAFIHCRVKDLGVKTVSWIRQKDLHILTTGLFIYTSDDRFSVAVQSNSDGTWTDWKLGIKAVQPKDAGVYECQVSTEPRTSKDFRLIVVETKARIVGSPSEVYVKRGSVLNLVCEMMVASHVVENVTMLWFHDGHEVVIDNENSLESVKIESKNVNISQTSRLKINNLQPKHAGVYSCSPSSCHLTSCSSPAFKTASTIVHVLNGEHPAAMQHSVGIQTKYSYRQVFVVFITCILNFLYCER